MTDFARLIGTLTTGDVAFILVGGVIDTKRAAGRPRDLEAIAELEMIRQRARDGS